MEEFVIEKISELSDISVSEINLTSKFSELNFDYLDIAELILVIENELKISISSDMFYVTSVNDLIELIGNTNNQSVF